MNSPGQSEPVTFLGDFSKKLVTNTFFNLLGRSWNFLVTLLLTPYLLAHLTKDEFAVWVLLTVFSNAFNLLDLGLGASFVKYISAYYTFEDYTRINQVLFSGLVFYGFFGVVLVGVGLALEGPLFRLFNISNASDVFLLVLIAFAVQNIGAMFISVFRGVQRMDKSNALEIKMSVLSVAGTVWFLQMGFGMLGLAINGLICSVITAVVAWWMVRRMLPNLSLGWYFSAPLLKDMFRYGAQLQISRLGGLICFQMDKLIISSFLGIVAVSFYEISSRAASFMRAVPLVMISAIIPVTSELGARNDRERILRTYFMASKYVSMLTVALIAYVALEAGSIVSLWIGPGFEESVVLIQILAIGYGVNVMGGAASQTGAGIGRPEFDMRSTIVLAILNPILSLTLVRYYGAAGAAAGTSLALVSAAIYLLVTFHRNYAETPVWSIIRDIYLRPIFAGTIALIAVLGFHQAVPQVLALQDTRYLIPLKLLLDFAVFSPIYMALLIALRQITAIDRSNFLGLLSFGFEFIRHPTRERVKIYR